MSKQPHKVNKGGEKENKYTKKKEKRKGQRRHCGRTVDTKVGGQQKLRGAHAATGAANKDIIISSITTYSRVRRERGLVNIHQDVCVAAQSVRKKERKLQGGVPFRSRATGIPKCHVMPDYGLPFFHTDAFASAAAGVVVRFFRVHDFLLAACSARCGAICWHWHLFILTEKTAKRQKRAKSTKVKQEDLWGFRLVGFVICCGGAPPFTFFSLFSLAYVFVCSIWFCFYYWLSSLLAARLRKAPLHLTSHSFRRVGLSCCNNIPLF